MGRIVAFKFRTQELGANISSLEVLIKPKKEELKQHRRTGLAVSYSRAILRSERSIRAGYSHVGNGGWDSETAGGVGTIQTLLYVR